MGKGINYIDPKEFREFGFLQEVNRQFFHPLGMALEVYIDEDGNETIKGVWDYRKDDEGMCYSEGMLNSKLAHGKARRVEELRKSKVATRVKELGYKIQPIEEVK